MSNLTILSDAELDAVSGGHGGITITGGAGGNGGSAANAVVEGNDIYGSWVSVNVSHSSANANGGAGGAGVVVPIFFF